MYRFIFGTKNFSSLESLEKRIWKFSCFQDSRILIQKDKTAGSADYSYERYNKVKLVTTHTGSRPRHAHSAVDKDLLVISFSILDEVVGIIPELLQVTHLFVLYPESHLT